MLLFFLATAYASITNCGTSSKFTIQTLSQTPADTIKAGENVTLTLFYTNTETVLSGSATTSVTYNFIPISPTLAPLCESIVCPLEPGIHDGRSSTAFPTGLSGTVKTKIVWKNDAGEELLCLSSTLKAA